VFGFRQQPEARTFAELRQELRRAGRGELLAELCATWAQHERDPVRAADAWSEAGESMVVLGELATAIEYLRTALDLDPTNDRATDRLLEIVEPGDPALAVEIIEHELAELAQPGNRRASGPADMAAPRRRHQHAASMERSPRPRRSAVALPAGGSGAHQVLTPSASSINRSVTMRWSPALQRRLDMSASKSAQRSRRRAGGSRCASAISRDRAATSKKRRGSIRSRQVAERSPKSARRIRDGGGGAWHRRVNWRRARPPPARTRDDRPASTIWRAAGRSDAKDARLQQALLGLAWERLDPHAHRSASYGSHRRRRAAPARRAVRNQLPDRRSRRVLSSSCHEPPHSKAARELRELLHDDQEWDALSRLMEAEINALGQDPSTPASVLVDEILELATVAREHMGDRDRAAELLHQALSVDPTHEEALARYVDHFRERRDWRGLIELMEFALDNVRAAGAGDDDVIRRLEEIAQLAELRLGTSARDRRLAADRAAEPGAPRSPRRCAGCRRARCGAAGRDPEHEVAAAPTASQRNQVLRKPADLPRAPDRATPLGRAVQRRIIADNPRTPRCSRR
jgi:tetratricopeptide (TPR) repeat protein